ncbi:MAG: hypothetical protein WKF50_13020 [Nocardioides sp.]
MSESNQEHEQEHESAGLPDSDEVSAEEKEELEQERQERLDPDSRPDGAEIDNTDRDFDPETGLFTDNPDHAEAEPQFSADDEA